MIPNRVNSESFTGASEILMFMALVVVKRYLNVGTKVGYPTNSG